MVTKPHDRMAKSSICLKWKNCPACIIIDKNHTFEVLCKRHTAIYSGKPQDECIQVAEITCFGSCEPTSLASITSSI